MVHSDLHSNFKINSFIYLIFLYYTSYFPLSTGRPYAFSHILTPYRCSHAHLCHLPSHFLFNFHCVPLSHCISYSQSPFFHLYTNQKIHGSISSIICSNLDFPPLFNFCISSFLFMFSPSRNFFSFLIPFLRTIERKYNVQAEKKRVVCTSDRVARSFPPESSMNAATIQGFTFNLQRFYTTKRHFLP